MTADPLACVDLIAWRRYAYGKAAANDGDFAAAAEMFEQALEQTPDWPPASFALAEAREKLGDVDGAADAFRKTLEADPSDAQGALPRLALIGRADPPPVLPHAYVARLFDDYAPHFDVHLTQKLHYRGPALIAEALNAAVPGRRFAHALDIGCGAGLMAAAMRSQIDRLTGVDLSPAMTAKAHERGLYDTLKTADALGFLQTRRPAPSTAFSPPMPSAISAILSPFSPPAGARSPTSASSPSRSKLSRAKAFGCKGPCASLTLGAMWKQSPARPGSLRCSSGALRPEPRPAPRRPASSAFSRPRGP